MIGSAAALLATPSAAAARSTRTRALPARHALLTRKLTGDNLHTGLEVATRHHGHRAVGLADRHLDRLGLAVGIEHVDGVLAAGVERGRAVAALVVAAAAAARHERAGDPPATVAGRRLVGTLRYEAQRRIGHEQRV